MPLPTASDVHVNAALSNISIAYMQEAAGFVADKVFPIVPVQKQGDRYFVYNRGDLLRSEAALRAPGTESAGGGFRLDNSASYFCDVYAIHKNIDDQVRANADAAVNVEADAARYVTQQLMMKRDRVWADGFFKTGIWDIDLDGVTGVPGAGEFKRWDESGATPIDNIMEQSEAIMEKTGKRPNTLVLSAPVYRGLRNNDQVIERIKYTQRGIVTTDILASLLDLDKVIVASATNNTAAEGAAVSTEFILGKSALLTYSAPNPSLLTPSGGYMFSWNGLTGAGPEGNRIKRYRMEHLAADRIEGEMAFDAKLVSSECGAFFENAVS